jgi:hypothetical protein
MRNIALMLARWGVWARDHSEINYSHIAAGFKGLLPGKGRAVAPCCDNDGLLIDRAVGQLKVARQPRDLEIILRHYVYGESKSAIALKWKCSEREIRRHLQIVEGFIDGCLSMAGSRLEMEEYNQQMNIDKKIFSRPEKNIIS